MSNAKQDALSGIQVTALISSSIIGVVVLTLPRLAVEAAQNGAVISVFITGVASMVLVVIAAFLGKRFPNQSIMEYSVAVLGRIPAKLLGLAYVTYFTLVTGVVLRSFADALKVFMLVNTPLEFIMIAMLIIVLYIVHNGIGPIAKVSESFLPLIAVILLLVIVLNYRYFDIDHLRVMLSNSLLPALKGVPDLMVAYLGFEIIFFVVPFMQKQDKVIPYAAAGMALPIIIYTGLVGVSIGVLGTDFTKHLVYPTVVLARTIEFPGAFIERFDIFFITLWILAAFTSITIFFYMASLSSARSLGLKNFRPFIFLLLPFIYLIAILPQNIYQLNQLEEISGYLGIGLMLVTIVLLLIVYPIRKRGKNHAAEK